MKNFKKKSNLTLISKINIISLTIFNLFPEKLFLKKLKAFYLKDFRNFNKTF